MRTPDELSRAELLKLVETTLRILSQDENRMHRFVQPMTVDWTHDTPQNISDLFWEDELTLDVPMMFPP